MLAELPILDAEGTNYKKKLVNVSNINTVEDNGTISISDTDIATCKVILQNADELIIVVPYDTFKINYNTLLPFIKIEDILPPLTFE